MASVYPEDAWQEYFLLGITPQGGSAIQFAGITEDITAMEWGSKDIEGIPLVNGGRVVKRAPMGDESISFKVYPVSAGTDGSGVIQLFHPDGVNSFADGTEPYAINNSHYRRKYRLVLLWCTTAPDSPLAAETAPMAGTAAYRIQIFNTYMTEVKPSFDDKILSTEMTFKWTPFQKDGTRNKIEESTVGSAVLPAVTTY
jgi:hypothetical protein